MSDAAERLRPPKAFVPPRDTTLPASQNTVISGNPDTSIPRHLNSKKSKADEIQTKQTTMRLEKGISDRLQDLCQQHGLSREVLIEALLVQFDNNAQIQPAVLSDAQQRHERRLQSANRKRAQTMIDKFGA